MAKQRIEYIDLAKGFCIVLVVWYHVALFHNQAIPCSDFFKAFRLPLYFFLSGCFFKAYDGFFDFLKRKTNKLLIPFLFWFLLISVLGSNFFVRVLHFNRELLPFGETFSALWYEHFPNEPIWFLLCLFEESILFYGIYKLSQKVGKYGDWVLLCSTIVLGFIGLTLSLQGINLPLFLDSALSSIPFFAFGYFVYRKTDILKPNKYDKYLPLLIIVAFALVFPLCIPYSFMGNSFTPAACWVVYPCGMLGTYGVVMLSKLLKRLPLISYLGHYSIMVLVTHVEVYKLWVSVLKLVGLPWEYSCYPNLLLTLLSYLVIIPLLKKFMPHVTAQKDIIKVS